MYLRRYYLLLLLNKSILAMVSVAIVKFRIQDKNLCAYFLGCALHANFPPLPPSKLVVYAENVVEYTQRAQGEKRQSLTVYSQLS